MEVFIAFIFGIIMGVCLSILMKRKDGRIIIDKITDDYYVAITTKPEDLEKRRWINLKVRVVKQGGDDNDSPGRIHKYDRSDN